MGRLRCAAGPPAVSAFTTTSTAEAGKAAELLRARIEHGSAPDQWLDPPG